MELGFEKVKDLYSIELALLPGNYRPRQVFAHGAFTHTTAVQSIESGFFMRMIVRA